MRCQVCKDSDSIDSSVREREYPDCHKLHGKAKKHHIFCDSCWDNRNYEDVDDDEDNQALINDSYSKTRRKKERSKWQSEKEPRRKNYQRLKG